MQEPTGAWAQYLRDHADQPGRLWLFQHLPKTAGSSFRQELAEVLHPSANIHADHHDLQRPALDSLNEANQRFIAELPTRGYRFASGHLRQPQVEAIVAAWPNTVVFTMLREPVARMISDYRYMRTPAHPSHQQVIARYPRLEEYLAQPATHNKMFRFLRAHPRETVDELIARLESRYLLVGTQAHYDLCCTLLLRLLGRPRRQQVHNRRTEDLASNQIPNLSELMPQLLAANQHDLRLYQHFASKLDALQLQLSSTSTAEALGNPR